MDKLLLIDRYTFTLTRISLTDAARLMDVEQSHIEWAIEEYGRCDVDYRTVIKKEFHD